MKLKNNGASMKSGRIKIVDLFAGPGGLGEGFSSVDAFQIAVSAEMESSAHATLRLRAFYRILKREANDEALAPYYSLCNGTSVLHPTGDACEDWDAKTRKAWTRACSEALQLTLGNPEDNARLDEAIKDAKVGPSVPWVLIGGPPCQAYSLVGRSRNMGKADYKAENDHRHFLYREYLRIINEYKPSVFVMENVKGILSSRIDGKYIFHRIMNDLTNPEQVFGKVGNTQGKYNIYSLVSDTVLKSDDDPESIDPRKFVVRAEDYGIPQARHRVILIGVRNDLCENGSITGGTLKLTPAIGPFVAHAISDLPKLRSTLSKSPDSDIAWREAVKRHAVELSKEAKASADFSDLSGALRAASNGVFEMGLIAKCNERYKRPSMSQKELRDWYASAQTAKMLKRYLNHEPRGHMVSDLRRYFYAATFAQEKGMSPKGHKDFALSGLAPAHENWTSGKFSDRFRVQVKDRPSTTITSHISKDGHYFIHYDPLQCRSLTVREAARLQTFPDNYFFQGNRTQQYHQVGNAVPPFLAHKIAVQVLSLLNKAIQEKAK